MTENTTTETVKVRFTARRRDDRMLNAVARKIALVNVLRQQEAARVARRDAELRARPWWRKIIARRRWTSTTSC